MTERVHHSAICVADVDASLRFYRDGIGMTVLMDQIFEGDWPALFGADARTLRSVMLGDPGVAEAGIVELVQFAPDAAPAPGTGPASVERWRTPPEAPPSTGFFLLSCFVDVEATLARLAGLGLGGTPRRTEQPAPGGATVPMATVLDPDGVLVELIGAPVAGDDG